ncbi:MAG: DNA primase [Lachnospiraceae bacterium]|nr:DNA primase [Lachnospiraceae bacterium]
MYYPDELVEEVREKNDIVDVISGYVRLKKQGNNYFGLCPFHNEKSPSFSVSQNKQMFHCFGCGAGGNVFTFVMQYENYTFPEAIGYLAEKAGVALPEVSYDEEARKKDNRRARILELNKAAAKFYYYMLRSPQGAYGMEYLKNRALSGETINRFGLGCSSKYSDELLKYLRKQGYSDELMREAGLVNFDEKNGLYDKFWNRVMFPIQDVNHRVIGFGGRVMGDGKPKYLNSPETIVFDKSRNLYGLNHARTSRKNHMILCEGYMDVIAMHQAGFTEAVASLGTAFTSGQASLLKRYAKEVLLTYDSDEAGTKAALRAIPILKEAGLTARVIHLEPYKDPDELIKNQGAEEFQKRIDEAENSFFFEIRVLQKDYRMDDPTSQTEFYRAIAEKLCGFPEELERENYLTAVAREFMIQPEQLRKLVVSYAARMGGIPEAAARPKPTAGKNKQEDAGRTSQKLLLTWLVDEPEVYPIVRRYIQPEDFTVELYRKTAERLFADMERGAPNPAAIISMFTEEEEQREAAELFNTKLPELSEGAEKERALQDIIYRVKQASYEYASERLGEGPEALMRSIERKRELEELRKVHISLKSGSE